MASSQLNIADLKSAVQTAVRELHADHRVLLPPDITLLPDRGIIGFIIKPDDLEKRGFGEVAGLATKLSEKLPAGLGAVTPSIVMHDKGVLVGFFPASNVLKL